MRINEILKENATMDLLSKSGSEPETVEIIRKIPENAWNIELVKLVLNHLDTGEGHVYRFFPVRFCTPDVLDAALRRSNPYHSEYYSVSDAFGQALRGGKIPMNTLQNINIVNMLRCIFQYDDEYEVPSENFNPVESLAILKKYTSPDMWEKVNSMNNPYEN